MTTTASVQHQPAPTLETFGARLALIRWYMQWNQKEAALACGLPQNSWREWEQGRSPRNLVQVAGKVHAATGIDEYWIIAGRELPNGTGSPGRDRTCKPAGFLGSPKRPDLRVLVGDRAA